jgi:hypothetical protein
VESYQSTWNAGSAMRAGIALFITWGLLTTVSPAEEIRDYYAEPGLNPFKETVNQDFHEHIDPFSGTLQLKYTDLIVPGNGGMDIRIHRVYTSLQEWELGVRRATGVGWTMHFGRIVVPQAHVDKICNPSSWLCCINHLDAERSLEGLLLCGHRVALRHA